MKWLQAHERPREQDPSMAKEAARGSPVMEQMAHEVYRVVLFGVFYLQVSLLGYVPYIGKPFALLYQVPITVTADSSTRRASPSWTVCAHSITIGLQCLSIYCICDLCTSSLLDSRPARVQHCRLKSAHPTSRVPESCMRRKELRCCL